MQNSIDRKVKSREEYRMKLEKGQLDYSRMLDDEELGKDIICPKCKG